jgi:hypothetical protein
VRRHEEPARAPSRPACPIAIRTAAFIGSFYPTPGRDAESRVDAERLFV